MQDTLQSTQKTNKEFSGKLSNLYTSFKRGLLIFTGSAIILTGCTKAPDTNPTVTVPIQESTPTVLPSPTGITISATENVPLSAAEVVTNSINAEIINNQFVPYGQGFFVEPNTFINNEIPEEITPTDYFLYTDIVQREKMILDDPCYKELAKTDLILKQDKNGNLSLAEVPGENETPIEQSPNISSTLIREAAGFMETTGKNPQIIQQKDILFVEIGKLDENKTANIKVILANCTCKIREVIRKVQAILTPTLTSTSTATKLPTITRTPLVNTSTPVHIPSASETPVPTRVVVTNTPFVPTATEAPKPTPTSVLPTATRVPTNVPTEVPTQVPTTVPTEVPTQVPTVPAKLTPTQVPLP